MNISAMWRTTLLGPQIPQTASKSERFVARSGRKACGDVGARMSEGLSSVTVYLFTFLQKSREVVRRDGKEKK